MVGRRHKAFERFCEIDEDGNFKTHCGVRHRKEKKLQNGENEVCDERRKAKMLYKEDKRAHCIRESKIRLVEEGQLAPQNKEKRGTS